MVALSSRQGQQIQMLKSAVSKLSINYTGTLLWKITDWSAKMTEARGKDGLELVSPPFYTSQYGYKLQASMFLNGNGPGENTHVSVYIKVLPSRTGGAQRQLRPRAGLLRGQVRPEDPAWPDDPAQVQGLR